MGAMKYMKSKTSKIDLIIYFHYKITSPSGLELITQCYFEVDPLIDGDWEENHPGLVIPLEETENGLVGIFDIVMNEEASIVSIDNKPFTLPKRFNRTTPITIKIRPIVP